MYVIIDKNCSSSKLITKLICNVFPMVDRELDRWSKKASVAEDDVLRAQALSSISHKRFHALGGCVYSLYPGVDMESAIRYIVSLQTISDYLDNLCDRAGIWDEAAFRQLHLAMTDAVYPGSAEHDYYLYYPHKNDSGYLDALVAECRQMLRPLPSAGMIEKPMHEYASLYSNLQIYKHLEQDKREMYLRKWTDPYMSNNNDLSWWELAAATGSTLGLFLLFAAAHDASLAGDEVKSIETAYFPWMCGLHILLDYYIDSEEDRREGDLNFTSYYSNQKHCKERLSFFIRQSVQKCSCLKYPEFHLTIIRGLLAMYLSDPKTISANGRETAGQLLKDGGRKAASYYHICRILRRIGKL
ncbi:MAG: tetraprenyl-beta-curcumene synthase family protein [Clostridiaceae bacterium]